MTYLEIVNAVLVRLREDSVTSVDGNDDPVVDLVKAFVNDAKRTCESAHTWSALSDEWSFATADGTDTYTINGGEKLDVIDVVYRADGTELKPMQIAELRRRALRDTGKRNTPQYYAVNGRTSGDYSLRVWPTPNAVSQHYVYGYKRQDDLALDTDVLLIPAQPVVHMALALASRERGETGAQSMGEHMAVAKQYLMDAIAKDATNSDLDNIWTSV